MNKLICKAFGHKWRYNFSWMPSKCICERCKTKAIFIFSKKILESDWQNVDSFEGENRTDKELINKWTK